MDDICAFTRRPLAFLAHYVKRRGTAHGFILASVLGAVISSIGAQYGVKMLVDSLAGDSVVEVAGVWLAFATLASLIAADNLLWRLALYIGSFTFTPVTRDIRPRPLSPPTAPPPPIAPRPPRGRPLGRPPSPPRQTPLLPWRTCWFAMCCRPAWPHSRPSFLCSASTCQWQESWRLLQASLWLPCSASPPPASRCIINMRIAQPRLTAR